MLEWMDLRVDAGLSLRLLASTAGLRAILFNFNALEPLPGGPADGHPLLSEAASQLAQYFAGELTRFDLPLDPAGTDFQKRVWREVAAIRYGETRTYLEIATALGAPGSVRAVGAANGANALPIIVPCHRVIGASGKLVGYAGGLPLKRRLLELEGVRSGLFAPAES